MIPVNTPMLGTEELSAVSNVLRSGVLTSAARSGGEHVQQFEKLASAFVKSKFAVAVSSGTAALQAALLALDVKAGDEILLPSFTFVATANAVLSTGARPVFVDVSRENYTMSPEDLEKKLTAKSKAIIPVHLYGNVAFIDEIFEIAKKNDLRIIEDAAQSLGSTFAQRHAGTFGDLGCYSLYPTKTMTAGEGGFVVTDNEALHERLLTIRNHGMISGHDTSILGLNLRLPEINAAIASVQIQKLPGFLSRRRENARLLSDLIADTDITIPKERTDERVNWSLYTISVENRDALGKKLNSNGFGSAVYYSTPVHKMPLYRGASLPDTDWAADHVLSLPVHPGVTTRDIDRMAKVIHDVD